MVRTFLQMKSGTLKDGIEKYCGRETSFAHEIVDHPNYVMISNSASTHILQHKHAVMTVGGWFDAEDLR